MVEVKFGHRDAAVSGNELYEGAVWGHRLLLGREATHGSDVETLARSAHTWQELRQRFLKLPEYSRRFETIGLRRSAEPVEKVDIKTGVLWGYRFYFNRDPAHQEVEYQANRAATVRDIREIFLLSREFELAGGYGAPELLDLEVLSHFSPFHTVRPEAGFFCDFLGTRTRLTCLPSHYASKSGTVEGGPNSASRGVHATAEWIGTLRAVLEADRAMVAIELGAGWAPWLVVVAAAARAHGISDLKLVAVEGSEDHVAYARQHFLDNGLEPGSHGILHAVVGCQDGIARFPKLKSPNAHYGANAAFGDDAAVEQPDYDGWEDVRCISLRSLLARFTTVDIVHCDIQGSELEVLQAGMTDLNRIVRRVVVGTHSRRIDAELLQLFSDNGWYLEFEKSCGVQQRDDGEIALVIDGEQVWRNSRFPSGFRRAV
jgi:FkbM family methyltransferase